MVKKILVIGIILLFLGISINPSVAIDIIKNSKMSVLSGKTLYVGGTGPDNYTTILSAVYDAVDGDIVFVYDDSSPYNERFTIPTSINLVGENKYTTIINSGNYNYPVITLTGYNITVRGFTIQSGEQGIRIKSENNTISNNIIKNNYCGVLSNKRDKNIVQNNIIESNDHYAIKVDGVKHWIITDNELEYNDKRTLLVDGNNEIKVEYSDNVTISNNVINTDDANCIFLRGGKNNTIINNYLYSKSKKGINVVKSKVDNKIIGNRISDCGCFGIRIGAGDYYIIKNNTLINNGFYITNSYQNTFENNIVNGRPVVYLDNCSNKKIEGDVAQIFLMNCNNITIENQYINDSDCGILLWNSQNCNIINNNIYSNQYYGIYIWLSNLNNDIYHNRIYDNGNGIYIGTSTNVNIENNLIESNENGVNLVEVTFCTIRNNIITKNKFGVIFENFEDESQEGNIVEYNNFVLNIYSAYFDIAVEWYYHPIIWKRNYWNRPRLLPKPIFGGYFVGWYWNDNGRPYRWIIRYLLIDWHPAREPHDIEV